jgi:SulP family sulfate permease
MNLQKIFPFLTWLPNVTKETLRADMMAAITGAIVVLPQGVAFAAIAGMPPQYGLFTAMVPAIIAAMWGSSKHLVSGPTTAASIMLAAFLATLAEPASEHYVVLALTITFMVGVVQITMGALKLGALVNFISHSVIVGFTAGAGILIGFKQIKNFFAIPIPRGSYPHEIVHYFVTHTNEINWFAAAVGITTLLSGIIVKKWFKKIPYMIAAMVVGSLAGVFLNEFFGEMNTHIKTVGKLTDAIPPLSMPDFSLETFKTLAPAVLAITFLALTEAVAIAKSIAVKSGQKLDGNQEFIGQGLSNLVGSFFSSYVATGSFNRSGVNYEAGAKSPLAAAIAGVLLIIILLLVAPLAAYLPVPSMAAILLLVAYGIIDVHHMKLISKTSKGEAAVLFVTFFSTLILHLDTAIILGVIASFIYYLLNTSRPYISVRVPNDKDSRRKFTERDEDNPYECPQVKFIRVDGSLFFGALGSIEERFDQFEKEQPEQKHICLLSQGINFVDVAGSEFLVKLAENKRGQGGDLYIYKAKPNFLRPLLAGDHMKDIGKNRFYDSKGEMIDAIIPKLDMNICEKCDKRIFKECTKLPGASS